MLDMKPYGGVCVVSLCSFLFLPLTSSAQHDADVVAKVGDEIVVTARGIAVPSSQTPGSVGVLSGGEIREEHPVSIVDSFRLVPGVGRNSDSMWGSEASIRGLTRDSVVMMIDDCRVNTASDIAARFGLLDPLEVERVEILKGPISSLYGSGSMGGVVNIVTRSGEFTTEPAFHGGASRSYASNPEGFDAFGFADYNFSNIYYYGSQSWRKHHSYKDGNGDTVRNSQYEDYGSKLKSGFLLPGQKLEINVQYFEGREIGIPGSGTAPLPSAADVTYPKVDRGLFNISDTIFVDGEIWRESRLMVFSQFIDRNVRIDNFPAASPIASIYPSATHDTLGGRWMNLFKLDDNAISAGADVWQRKLKDSIRTRNLRSGQVVTDQPLPDASFMSSGSFIEDDWTPVKSLTFNVGGRVDLIEVSNETDATWPQGHSSERSASGHAGATWRATDNINLKIIGASGYRAASLKERFVYLDLGGGITKYGDPDLSPERSQSLEYGMDWFGDNLYLSASVFVNRLTDLIAERKTDATTVRNANINKATIQGVEGEGKYNMFGDNLQIYANIAWLEGRDTLNDLYLPGIAPLSVLSGIRCGSQKSGPWAKLEMLNTAKQDKVPAGTTTAPGLDHS